MLIYAPISVGELIDKITILTIKADRLQRDDGPSYANVAQERGLLTDVAGAHGIALDDSDARLLQEINRRLWVAEDQIRLGGEVALWALRIVQLNDERAAVKRTINQRYGSGIVEEKTYLTDAARKVGLS